MKSGNIKYYILLISVYFLLFGYKWASFPSYIDEYNTILLANGIPVHIQATVKDRNLVSFQNITSGEIMENNKLSNILKLNIKDGGNAPAYFIISHFTSISLGKYLGILNSLRLVSNLFSIGLLLLFFSFISKKNGKLVALKCSLLLIFLMIQFGDYIRTYPISGFFSFVFFVACYQIIEGISNKKEITKINYLVLIITSVIIPFFHHFNIFFLIFFLIIIVLYHISFNPQFEKIIPILSVILLSITSFSIYYFSNPEGSEFQLFLNNYWHEYARKYNSSENNWLYPSKLKYLVFENNENLLFISGLNMGLAFPGWRMLYFSFLLIIPLFIAIMTFRDLKINHENYLLILSVSFIIYYLIILNVICLVSGHVTALNSSWYSYAILPVYCTFIACSLAYAKNKNNIVNKLFNFMIIIMCIKTLTYMYNFKKEGSLLGPESNEMVLIQKIENQFK